MNFYFLNGRLFEKVAIKAGIASLESLSWPLPYLTNHESYNLRSVAIQIIIAIVTGFNE